MSAPVWVLGYGSLMSARGLAAQAGAARELWPARLAAWRAFDKPAEAGFVAMDLAPPRRAALRARRAATTDVAAVDAALGGRAIGAVLVRFEASGTTALAVREGYTARGWERLLAAAGARGLGALLLDVARAAGDDPLAYRRALAELAGPSCIDLFHYLPHPVETDADPAVVFVAPEPGRTGDPRCESVKTRWPAARPVRLHELYAVGPRLLHGAFDPEKQRQYVEKCCLALAHGVDVGDLFAGPLAEDDPSARLRAGWAADPTPLFEEQDALRALLGLSPEAYARRFPLAPRRP